MRTWIVASLLGWGALSLAGMFWHPLRPASATTILLAMSGGCFANWIRNRTCHCLFSGPLLLLAAAVFLLSELRIVHVHREVVWVALLIGIAIAFLLEWRFARPSRPN
ncbi:MAG: hypothetical protein ACREH8_01065 [Opitutaceae bacterium]